MLHFQKKIFAQIDAQNTKFVNGGNSEKLKRMIFNRMSFWHLRCVKGLKTGIRPKKDKSFFVKYFFFKEISLLYSRK